MNIIDNVVAVRILYLLTLPFEKWEAFKEGIISADGEFITRGSDSENWTMLHRLVARLKIILEKIPLGKSRLASIAAAYLLVRESCWDNNIWPEDVEKSYERTAVDFKTYALVSRLLEDVIPTMGISQVAGIKPGDEPPGIGSLQKTGKKKKVIRRNGIPSIL